MVKTLDKEKEVVAVTVEVARKLIKTRMMRLLLGR